MKLQELYDITWSYLSSRCYNMDSNYDNKLAAELKPSYNVTLIRQKVSRDSYGSMTITTNNGISKVDSTTVKSALDSIISSYGITATILNSEVTSRSLIAFCQALEVFGSIKLARASSMQNNDNACLVFFNNEVPNTYLPPAIVVPSEQDMLGSLIVASDINNLCAQCLNALLHSASTYSVNFTVGFVKG